LPIGIVRPALDVVKLPVGSVQTGRATRPAP
jgi:hypothetical protein